MYSPFGYNPRDPYNHHIREQAQDNRIRSQNEVKRLAKEHSVEELEALLARRLADPAHDLIAADAKATVVSEARRALELKKAEKI